MKKSHPMSAKRATAIGIETLFSGSASLVAVTALLVVGQSAVAGPAPAPQPNGVFNNSNAYTTGVVGAAGIAGTAGATGAPAGAPGIGGTGGGSRGAGGIAGVRGSRGSPAGSAGGAGGNGTAGGDAGGGTGASTAGATGAAGGSAGAGGAGFAAFSAPTGGSGGSVLIFNNFTSMVGGTGGAGASGGAGAVGGVGGSGGAGQDGGSGASGATGGNGYAATGLAGTTGSGTGGAAIGGSGGAGGPGGMGAKGGDGSAGASGGVGGSGSAGSAGGIGGAAFAVQGIVGTVRITNDAQMMGGSGGTGGVGGVGGLGGTGGAGGVGGNGGDGGAGGAGGKGGDAVGGNGFAGEDRGGDANGGSGGIGGNGGQAGNGGNGGNGGAGGIGGSGGAGGAGGKGGSGLLINASGATVYVVNTERGSIAGGDGALGGYGGAAGASGGTGFGGSGGSAGASGAAGVGGEGGAATGGSGAGTGATAGASVTGGTGAAGTGGSGGTAGLGGSANPGAGFAMGGIAGAVGAGGAGIELQDGTLYLANEGLIGGGAGGVGMGPSGGAGANGGAGIAVSGGTAFLTNGSEGLIVGGVGIGYGAYGGAAIAVSGGTVAIDNSGRILGGLQTGVELIQPTSFGPPSSRGGAGILVESGSVSILNRGTILGGYEAVDRNGEPTGPWVQAGIVNTGGTITSLVNGQGASSSAGTALTYAGILPQEYQIIVDSHVGLNGPQLSYGQLAVAPGSTGNMAVGLSEEYSNFSDHNYTSAEQRLVGVLSGMAEPDRITVIDNQQITGANAGNWRGYINNASTHWVRWKGAQTVGGEDATSGDLILTFGADALNTETALRQSGRGLQSVMRSRLGDLLNTSNYDCRYFDERGLCLSVFARNGDSSVTNSTNAVVIGSLRLADHFRVGGFFDTHGSKQSAGGVSARDRSTFGGFAAFDENVDGTGFSAKVSAATKDGTVDINRTGSDADFTEAGSGKAKLSASTVAGEVGFGLRANGLLITPYLGFSHSTITRSAYCETAVDGRVVYPISYDKFRMRPESGTLGVKLQGKFDENIGYNLGAGVTGGLSRGMSGYAGTSSIIGLSSFRIDLPKGSTTGGFASAGLSYRIAKGLYVSGNVSVRQDPYYNKTGTYSFIGLSMGI